MKIFLLCSYLVYIGFSLGSTINSETKGIWAWCKPHPTQKEQVLLLLDTEGLGDKVYEILSDL